MMELDSLKRWRGALIGCGYVADRQLHAWQQIPSVQITAVCDLDIKKARHLAEVFGIERIYTDYKVMLDELSLDFVDIATRPESHLELVSAAAQRNLAILCQKPLANSMAEARQIIQVCNQAGSLFMVNENCRHQAWFRKLKALLSEGTLGSPIKARFVTRANFTMPFPDFGGQDYFAQMPQLIVFEMGIHFMDTARYLFGEADTIYARLKQVSPHIAGEDSAVLLMGFGDLTCTVDIGWFSRHEKTEKGAWGPVRVEGSEGTAILQKDGTLCLYRDEGEQSWHFPEDTILNSFTATQQHFIDCLQDGRSPETNGPETLKTMALVFAAYHSSEQGQVVKLNGINHIN